MTERRKPRSYTNEFKQQLVQLHQNGKRKCDICNKCICLEYDIATSLLDKCLKQSATSGSFHKKDKRSTERQELIELRKRNKQLEMENDIS